MFKEKNREEWNDGTSEYRGIMNIILSLHHSMISTFHYSRIVPLNFGIEGLNLALSVVSLLRTSSVPTSEMPSPFQPWRD